MSFFQQALGVVSQVANNPWVQQQVQQIVTNPQIAQIAMGAANDVVQKVTGGMTIDQVVSAVIPPQQQESTTQPSQTVQPTQPVALPACQPVVVVVNYESEVSDFSRAVMRLQEILAMAEDKVVAAQKTPLDLPKNLYSFIDPYRQNLDELISMQPGVTDRYRQLATAFASLQTATKSGTADKNASVPYNNALQALAAFTARIVKVQAVIEELVQKLTQAQRMQTYVAVFFIVLVGIISAIVSHLLTDRSKDCKEPNVKKARGDHESFVSMR